VIWFALGLAVAGLLMLARAVMLACDGDARFLLAMAFGLIGFIMMLIGGLSFLGLYFLGPVAL
jgi:hypothetical protein